MDGVSVETQTQNKLLNPHGLKIFNSFNASVPEVTGGFTGKESRFAELGTQIIDKYCEGTKTWYTSHMIPGVKIKFVPSYTISDHIASAKMTGILAGNTDWPIGVFLSPKWEWEFGVYRFDDREFYTYGCQFAKALKIEDITKNKLVDKYQDNREEIAHALFGKQNKTPLLDLCLKKHAQIATWNILPAIFHAKSHLASDSTTAFLFVAMKIAKVDELRAATKRKIDGLLELLDEQKSYLAQGRLATTASGLFKLSIRCVFFGV